MFVDEAVGGVFAALVAMADVETWEGVSERLGRDGGRSTIMVVGAAGFSTLEE